MKERLTTLALACGALALFYLLFVPKPTPDNEKITLPISSERGPNGYAALFEWLRAEKIPVVALRERYQRLPNAVGDKGNLLITTLPHRLSARLGEADTLKDWLRRGNTLLAMAALADTPDWAMQSAFERDLVAQLHALTGIRFVVTDDSEESSSADADDTKGAAPDATKKIDAGKSELADAFAKLLEPQRHSMRPIGAHPLTEGVRSVAALSEFPASDWRAESDKSAVVLELARDADSPRLPREPVLWLVQVGDGQIIVSGFGSPFTNKLLGEADNARLLSNVVRWSRDAHGTVFIDDAHQGAVAFYDPDAFYRDPRLHRTLGWLLLLWLVFVLGPSRLRSTTSTWKPADITSLVRASGGFIARTVKPAEAGRRAFKVFFNGIRRRLGLPENGEPVWEWLASQTQIALHDLAELRASHARLVAGRRIDLPKLHNLLHRITGGFA